MISDLPIQLRVIFSGVIYKTQSKHKSVIPIFVSRKQDKLVSIPKITINNIK